MTTQIAMPLGRKQEHDPKSRLFPYKVDPQAYPRSVSWLHFGTVSDQSSVPPVPKPEGWIGWGGCVGWTGLDWRNTQPNKVAGMQFHDRDGLAYYNGATENDEWNDNDRPLESRAADPDEGSSGLGLAKFFKAQGTIGSYRWGFTLDQFVIGLQEGPWACGLPWQNDMFEPDSRGQITPTGGLAGGHELLAVKLQYSARSPGKSRVWLLNHWTRKWGVRGKAWMWLQDFDALRRDGGDVLMMKKAA